MNGTATKAHRDTIFVEDAIIIAHAAHPGEQFILSVQSPECARRAVPGSFAHIQCARDIPMRRPLSIMRADPESGRVDFLYKVVGPGLRALSKAVAGETVSLLGPIGNGFSINSERPKKLMLGGGVGIPPMTFLAEVLAAKNDSRVEQLVLMGSEVPFPFAAVPSKLSVNGAPESATDAMPELESLNIPSRLTSLQGYKGAFKGYVTDLAKLWLQSLAASELSQVEIFACGPEPMLEAAARVAREFDVPCQLCLEEYMACAVGGCAGCAVPVHTDAGTAMKRVCVDGPVFAAASIYPG